jgi:prepilin-type N-terminal cleavage/methylation domain-containing protein
MSNPLRRLSRHRPDERRRRPGILKHAGRAADPRAVARAFSDRGRAEHGFTLIEVLVAALLVLIISAGVATALVSATDFSSHVRRSSQANAVAQQDQERLKSMSDSQLTSLHQTRTVTLNNTKFTVVSSASFIDSNGNSSCTSKAEAYFKLSSTVSSGATTNNPGQTFTAETLITRPLAGTLVVPVQNELNGPLSGAAVSVAGQNTGDTASATTDQNGCAAFAGLPTDGYTVTATAIGYVSVDGNASATETASVNQTTLTPANTLILGLAGQIRVQFMTRGTSTIYDGQTTVAGHGLAPSAYELSYYGSGNGNNMTTFACQLPSGPDCTGSGSPLTFGPVSGASTFALSNLFPFYINPTTQYNNNYQLWAGACEQEQPLQPLTGTGFASVTPGKTAALPTQPPDAYVDEPAIDVAVKYGGATYAPNHVTITFTGKSAGGTVNCKDVWHQVQKVGSETPTGYTGPYGTFPAPFASTAAKGTNGASNTGDTGQITSVCADYNGRSQTTTTAFTTSGNLNSPYVIATPLDVQGSGSQASVCP